MFSETIDGLSRTFRHQAFGLFLLRLVTGLIFLVHGAAKIGAVENVAQFFGTIGLAPSLEWAWFIGILEVLGGAALILGVATRFFGAVLGIEMIVAILLTGVGKGFNAHAFELLLGASAFAIALIGSGNWSLYKMECENCGGFLCEGDVCMPVERV